MSKEIAKTEITSMIVQLFVFALIGAIAIIGIIRDNPDVWQICLYALGVSGSGYIVKTVGSNSKAFKAVQAWITEHTPSLLGIFASKASGEVVKHDGIVERAVAETSSLMGSTIAKLEDQEIRLKKLEEF